MAFISVIIFSWSAVMIWHFAPTSAPIARVESELRAVPHWRQQGQLIVRTFQVKDFAAAIAFLNRVAALAGEAWHHPDLDVRWNTVRLTLTTHDAGGLTNRDVSLAAAIDAVVALGGYH
jgi:4a-hydroxytetrahydrobiopterin dehydratase